MPAYAMFAKKKKPVQQVIKRDRATQAANAKASMKPTSEALKGLGPLTASRHGTAECYVSGKRVPCLGQKGRYRIGKRGKFPMP